MKTCKSCKENNNLMKSHFSALRMTYKRIHPGVEISRDGKNKKIVKQKKENLLCSNCEKLFDTNVEGKFARIYDKKINLTKREPLDHLEYKTILDMGLSYIVRSCWASYPSIKLPNFVCDEIFDYLSYGKQIGSIVIVPRVRVVTMNNKKDLCAATFLSPNYIRDYGLTTIEFGFQGLLYTFFILFLKNNTNESYLTGCFPAIKNKKGLFLEEISHSQEKNSFSKFLNDYYKALRGGYLE